MKNEFIRGQVVWLVVNPMHMETIENDPVIKGEVEEIKRISVTNRGGEKVTIHYTVDTLWFEKYVEENEIFATKEEAVIAAKALINKLRENRLKTDQKLDEAFAAIGTDCD